MHRWMKSTLVMLVVAVMLLGVPLVAFAAAPVPRLADPVVQKYNSWPNHFEGDVPPAPPVGSIQIGGNLTTSVAGQNAVQKLYTLASGMYPKDWNSPNQIYVWLWGTVNGVQTKRLVAAAQYLQPWHQGSCSWYANITQEQIAVFASATDLHISLCVGVAARNYAPFLDVPWNKTPMTRDVQLTIVP